MPQFEFHVSRAARATATASTSPSSLSTATSSSADFDAARVFAHKLNARRDPPINPERAPRRDRSTPWA